MACASAWKNVNERKKEESRNERNELLLLYTITAYRKRSTFKNVLYLKCSLYICPFFFLLVLKRFTAPKKKALASLLEINCQLVFFEIKYKQQEEGYMV